MTPRIALSSISTIPKLGSRLLNIKASPLAPPTILRPIFRFQSTVVAIKMDKVDTTARLSKLRELMKEHEVDVYSKLTYVF